MSWVRWSINVPAVLADIFEAADLAVQLRDLAGELVDLADGLLDVAVKLRALRGQIVGRDVKGCGQVIGCGDYSLAKRQVGGTGRQLVHGVEELRNGRTDVPRTAGEAHLGLRQSGDQRAQLALGLGLLLDARFEDRIANTFNRFHGHAGAERQRVDDQRITQDENRNLARISRSVDVGDIVGGRLQSCLFGRESTQCGR